MRFADLPRAVPLAVVAAVAVAWLVLLTPGAGQATPAKRPPAGMVIQPVAQGVYVNGGPEFHVNYPLKAGDVLTLNPSGDVRFAVMDGKRQISCELFSKPVPGNVQVQPANGVSVAFNAGTSVCHTPLDERRTWQSWVNRHSAKLKFSDPVFSVVVGKGTSVVRVRRGVVVVSGSGGDKKAVAVGRNQQAAVTAGANPAAPVPTTAVPPTEQAVIAKIESTLPPVTDTTPPTAGIVSAPHDPSSVRSATFAFTANESGVTFTCSLDGSDFHVCTSPQHVGAPESAPLPPGEHTFAVKAIDAAGNVEKKPVTSHWTIDNSRILFTSTRDGNTEVYVMDPVADPTGKNATDLSNNKAEDKDPAWSPDRKRIAFQSNRSGSYNIWVMNADGSSPVQVTHDKIANDTNPTWSPDGKLIAFESDATGRREIYVGSSDGTGTPVQLTSNPKAGADANFDPAWSPKNDKIAFASTRDGNYEIYTMNIDGSGQKRLTVDSAVEFNPAWSPDGQQIAFHSDINGASKQIWVMDEDGSNAHRVVATASDDANPTWAPDGAELAFQGGPPGGIDIWIVGVDGSDLTRLTFAPGDDQVPDWR